MGWLEETRKKPKEVRKQYAFVGALGITGFIALFWLASLPAQIASIGNSTNELAAETSSSGAFSRAFSDARQNMAALFEGLSTSTPTTTVDVKTSTATEETPISETSASPAVVATSTTPTTASNTPETSPKPAGQVVLIATSSPATSTDESAE